MGKDQFTKVGNLLFYDSKKLCEQYVTSQKVWVFRLPPFCKGGLRGIFLVLPVLIENLQL